MKYKVWQVWQLAAEHDEEGDIPLTHLFTDERKAQEFVEEYKEKAYQARYSRLQEVIDSSYKISQRASDTKRSDGKSDRDRYVDQSHRFEALLAWLQTVDKETWLRESRERAREAGYWLNQWTNDVEVRADTLEGDLSGLEPVSTE